MSFQDPNQQPPYQQPPQYQQGPHYDPSTGSGYYQNQQYQYQQPGMMPPPPPKKSHKGLWITLGIIGVLLFACIGASFAARSGTQTAVNSVSTAIATTDTSSNTGSTTTTDNTTPVPSNGQVSKVGGTITLDGVEATLVSMKTNPGDQYEQPKAGYEYLIVHIKLHNTNDSERNYASGEFHIKSGTGNITGQEFVSFVNNNDLLSSYATLAAGGTAEGDLVFQAKKGDHKAMVTWQPNMFTSSAGDNGWLLGL